MNFARGLFYNAALKIWTQLIAYPKLTECRQKSDRAPLPLPLSFFLLLSQTKKPGFTMKPGFAQKKP